MTLNGPLQTSRILDLLSDIVPEGAYGTRGEWIDVFERTHATNAPPILFADAAKLGYLIEETPGFFCFVLPEQFCGMEGGLHG